MLIVVFSCIGIFLIFLERMNNRNQSLLILIIFLCPGGMSFWWQMVVLFAKLWLNYDDISGNVDNYTRNRCSSFGGDMDHRSGHSNWIQVYRFFLGGYLSAMPSSLAFDCEHMGNKVVT